MKTIKLLLSVFLLGLVSINGYAEKKISPQSVDGATTVNTTEAKKLFDDGVLFVDVRSPKAWNAGRIADSILLDSKTSFNEQALLAEMKKSDPVVIYCNGETCLRSAAACKKAVSWQFAKVYYYRDGYPAWKAAGYPIE